MKKYSYLLTSALALTLSGSAATLDTIPRNNNIQLVVKPAPANSAPMKSAPAPASAPQQLNNNARPAGAPPLNNTPALNYNNGPQTITGVIPAEGTRATPITVSGTHFGSNASAVQLKINGVAAIITGISDNQIQATVPDRAGSGPITVIIDGKTTVGSYFRYTWRGALSTFSQSVWRPRRLIRDSRGYLYVTDRDHHSIRQINNFGEATTIAGGGAATSVDGQGSAASFTDPLGLAVDGAGNLYVIDHYYTIRKISTTGAVTTIPGTGNSSFGEIHSIAVDRTGTTIYVGQIGKIRKLTPAGAVSDFVTAANFNATSMTVGPSGDLYVSSGYTLYKVNTAGMMSVLAGSSYQGDADGYGAAAHFIGITGLTTDPAGNIFACEYSGNDYGTGDSRIRKISRDGEVTTIKGTDGGRFSINWPSGIAVDLNNANVLYVSDEITTGVSKITLQ
ncbi:MAG TPA: IPT/TIG domain-containing protein [Puia sp.]